MILAKSRILLFRDQDSALYPLQMISLMEPNINFQKSDQHDHSIQINVQERKFHYQLQSDQEVIDKLERLRNQMQNEAKGIQKLKIVQQTQSKMNMMQSALKIQQETQSKRNLKSSLNLSTVINNPENVHKIMLANGSSIKMQGVSDDFNSMEESGKKSKILAFNTPFKPGKHNASIFLLGKARPPRLYPQHANQPSPFRHEQLSTKRFVYISAAKDGGHALGFTDNDWTFVWGESNYPGALGSGRPTKSTLPYIIKELKKQKVIGIRKILFCLIVL